MLNVHMVHVLDGGLPVLIYWLKASLSNIHFSCYHNLINCEIICILIIAYLVPTRELRL